MKTNRRMTRNYFPDPKFQFKFLRFVFFTAFVPVFLTILGLSYFVHENYELLIEYAGTDELLKRTLYAEMYGLSVGVACIFFFYLLAVFVMAVLFSHRVAGALYAVKRTIREINQGKDSRLRLREKDEFQELVAEFNLMVDNLKNAQKKTGT